MIRRTLLQSSSAIAFALCFSNPLAAQSATPIEVVATFSILGDMVSQVGGEHVVVTTLVGPNADSHVYTPTPADAQTVNEAEVLFINGLEFEGWIERLVDASGFAGAAVVTTQGIEALPFLEGDAHDEHGDKESHHEHHEDEHEAHEEDHHEEHEDHKESAGHEGSDDPHEGHAHHHGTFDPHAWQNLANGALYVANIASALSAADPENAESYEANAAAYIAEIQSLDEEIFSLIATLPPEARTVVTSHDAFGYFEARYGISFQAPQGLSTESRPSAADVARLIIQIQEEDIRAVFVESITDNRLLELIASETGVTIGGTLYSDALSGENGPASTYLDMMRHNATTIVTALR